MSAKATHRGTCQCCGSVQKLPGGSLSKHGYTVQWSFFSGVCAGAGELPYEVSCDLISRSIAGANAQRQNLVQFRDQLLQPATEAKAWHREYVKGHKGVGTYQWRVVELEMSGPVTCYRPSADGIKHGAMNGLMRLPIYEPFKGLLEAATLMNAKRAESVSADIERLDQYITWQQNRIATWHPTDLLPLS